MLGRSWYRFSLRSLLVTCAVCCAALAVYRWCFAPDPIVAELESLGCKCRVQYLEESRRLRANEVWGVGVTLPLSKDADAARINQLLDQLPHLEFVRIHDDLTGIRDPTIDNQAALVLDGLGIEELNCGCHVGVQTAKALPQTNCLRRVYFQYCPPDSIMETLVQHHSLQEVRLRDAEISTLALLSREHTLMRLHLHEPKLEGLFALETLPKSVAIYLALATLDDDSLQSLSRLSIPFHLDAYDSNVSDEGLAAFEAAQTPILQIGTNSPHVTDLGLSRLSRVRVLEVVHFRSVTATESGIVELLNAGKRIHIHSLSKGQRFDIDEVRRRCPDARIEAHGFGGFSLYPPAR